MEKDQEIYCSVKDCRFHANHMCTLKAIKVTKCNADQNKEATICDSYENREE